VLHSHDCPQQSRLQCSLPAPQPATTTATGYQHALFLCACQLPCGHFLCHRLLRQVLCCLSVVQGSTALTSGALCPPPVHGGAERLLQGQHHPYLPLKGPVRPTHDVAALPSVNQAAHRQFYIGSCWKLWDAGGPHKGVVYMASGSDHAMPQTDKSCEQDCWLIQVLLRRGRARRLLPAIATAVSLLCLGA
jgi:hypothetical protein